ncbi:hypothetical protein ANO11243_082000 [Dothideomycetidae sp. 11243]|nr:hypothetical protein ANO11243_082000 [fungal sp. No.11243]
MIETPTFTEAALAALPFASETVPALAPTRQTISFMSLPSELREQIYIAVIRSYCRTGRASSAGELPVVPLAHWHQDRLRPFTAEFAALSPRLLADHVRFLLLVPYRNGSVGPNGPLKDLVSARTAAWIVDEQVQLRHVRVVGAGTLAYDLDVDGQGRVSIADRVAAGLEDKDKFHVFMCYPHIHDMMIEQYYTFLERKTQKRILKRKGRGLKLQTLEFLFHAANGLHATIDWYGEAQLLASMNGRYVLWRSREPCWNADAQRRPLRYTKEQILNDTGFPYRLD